MLIPSSLQNSYSSIKEIKEVSMPNEASLVVQGRPWPSTTGILSTVIALSAPWTGTDQKALTICTDMLSVFKVLRRKTFTETKQMKTHSG